MGRRSDNDIVVDETTVSRRHSLIMETPDGYVVRDLNTTNGTFVNQNWLDQSERILHRGDQIRLGGSEVTIMFRQEGPRTMTMTTAAPPLSEQPAAPITDLSIEHACPTSRSCRDTGGRGRRAFIGSGIEKGTVVSRVELLGELWPDEIDDAGTTFMPDAAVARVRSQLDQDPDNPVSLVTVGNFGYLLV
ncbi:MAG: FHA domain-containing protein [SAR202 cluster bacterium]|nr:FHA domain-containing protein [SAR202 cluster bacterium]